jgi:hypothetical protein
MRSQPRQQALARTKALPYHMKFSLLEPRPSRTVILCYQAAVFDSIKARCRLDAQRLQFKLQDEYASPDPEAAFAQVKADAQMYFAELAASVEVSLRCGSPVPVAWSSDTKASSLLRSVFYFHGDSFAQDFKKRVASNGLDLDTELVVFKSALPKVVEEVFDEAWALVKGSNLANDRRLAKAGM